MSRRRRGRITVQHQPTKAGRFMMKGMGAVHASMGLVFVIVAATVIIPNAGLFGLPFLLGGAFFAVNGIRMLVSKNDIAHRVGYDIETDVQGETIVGLMDDVDELVEEEARRSEVREFTGDAEERLRQINRLKEAGLITEAEYEEKRGEIIDSL